MSRELYEIQAGGISYRLDVAARRVTGPGDAIIPVGGIHWDLLCYLIRSPGDVIKNDDLHRQVWVGKTVNEETVEKTIRNLRRLLGDKKPWRIIETVRGVGFRLNAAVLQITENLSNEVDRNEASVSLVPVQLAIGEATQPKPIKVQMKLEPMAFRLAHEIFQEQPRPLRQFELFCQNNLGYFSRSLFAKARNLDPNLFPDEEKIVQDFLQDNKKHLVIYGSGGSGKTTLLRRIAEGFENIEGLQTFYCIDPTGLEPADLRSLTIQNKALIVIDYFEKCPNFVEVSRALNKMQHVKTLLACRQSAIENIIDAVGEQNCHEIALSSSNDSEMYLRWVTENIVKVGVKGKLGYEVKKHYSTNPLMASFIAYQIFLNRIDKNAISIVRSSGDFHEWVTSSISSLANTNLYASEALNIKDVRSASFEIFANIYLSKISSKAEKIASILLDDGFLVIDRITATYSSAHDVIADAAIVVWLKSFRTPTSSFQLLADIQKLVSKYDTEREWLNLIGVFDRISVDKIVRADVSIQISEIIAREVLNQNQIGLQTILAVITSSFLPNNIKMMTVRDMLERGEDQYAIFKYIAAPFLDMLAEAADGNVRTLLLKRFDEALLAEADQIIAPRDYYSSNRLLVEAYRKFSERYEPAVLAFYNHQIKRENWKVIFLVIALLRESSSSEGLDLDAMTETCLNKFGGLKDARFLIEHYLQTKRDPVRMLKFARVWLQSGNHADGEFIATEGVYFLICEWVEAGGELDALRIEFDHWAQLKLNGPKFGVSQFLFRYFRYPNLYENLSSANQEILTDLAEEFLQKADDKKFLGKKFFILKTLFQKGLLKNSIAGKVILNTPYEKSLKYFEKPGDLINADVALNLANALMHDTINSPTDRRKTARNLAALDDLMQSLGVSSQYRAALSTWLKADDSGRKSFFSRWYRLYGTFTPFEKEAVDCWRFPGNKEELLSYQESDEWIQAVRDIDALY
ncbi:winged helix-turn-helix domain-containing protein [uncultured Roseibium sp.]|uniref:winged helix-turn-helix domain-containing protein n=1 Tax=uncultured Roseibium sp. TaxID=1936171 RepID=UPI002627B208|nr:winged helix-turn-helix domain-containing protein [uncultured Roseibium sp.]